MGFQSVPESVTLNELERRNGHYFAFAEFGSFRGQLRKTAGLLSHQQILPREMS